MAIINISLDAKSFEGAIKQVNSIYKKMVTKVPSVFIDKSLEWVKNRANRYLSEIEMDGEIISDIQGSWDIEKVSKNVKRLVNTSRKAVFVEFGVGRIGKENPHPQSYEENYEYDKPTRYKHSDGRWVFDARHKQYAIDLNEGYFGIYQRENSGKIVAITKGSPANLYLYNAMMDFISEGAYKMLWGETLVEVL